MSGSCWNGGDARSEKGEFHPKFPFSSGCPSSWADLRQIPQPESCRAAQPTGTMPAAPDHPGRQPQPPAGPSKSRRVQVPCGR
ncbi:hypothetical protein NEUTE2DRAFT_167906 [Neurospora tetrasperma FGSC 2509]|nr:hypothetical protein NEUTE2DRAFT_167906 [Neurospora tetrasperma FGSC 2509]